MRSKPNLLLAVGAGVVLWVAGTVSHAQRYVYVGQIGTSCKVLRDPDRPELIRHSDGYWAKGFLDGAHSAFGLQPATESINFTYARLEHECGKNPQKTFGEAMLTLFVEDRSKETAVRRSSAFQADSSERESLKQLPGVDVVVETIEADAEKDGLTSDAVHIDTEMRLRRARIRILSSLGDQIALGGTAQPYLYININTSKRADAYAVAIRVELKQLLTSTVTKRSTSGTTWERGHVGFVSASEIRTVLPAIGAMVDEFVSDWLASNSRP